MPVPSIFVLLVRLWQLMVLLQAEMLAWLCPAQVIGSILKRNRAHVVMTIRLPSTSLEPPRLPRERGLQTVLRLLKQVDRTAKVEEQRRIGARKGPKEEPVLPLEGFHVTHAAIVRTDGNGGPRREYAVVKAWYISRTFKWVDSVKLLLLPTAGGHVVAEAYSASTSIVPASLPFATLWALFTWYIPFHDHFMNYVHLREIRRHLVRAGLEVEENVLVHGGCLYSFEQKMGQKGEDNSATGGVMADFHSAIKNQ